MKQKVLYIIFILILALSLIAIFIIQIIPKNLTKSSLGVWWWDNRLDESYLDFAHDNNVTEIYYYTSSFSDKNVSFIEKANKYNIKVYWLAGKHEWIEDYDALDVKIKEYIDFQNTHNNLFAGIHFDIEPHQHPEFENRRNELLTLFVRLTYKIKLSYPKIFVEYDLPCWLDDIITYNDQSKKAYEHIFDNANRITLMSYRDSAEEIYNFAQDEIAYAIKTNRQIILGVNTNDSGDTTTFLEEGNQYMLNELSLLSNMIPKNFGIAIHHIASWVELASK